MYDFYKRQGVEIVNDRADFVGTNGCYLFRGQTGKTCKSDNMEGNILVIAPHQGFINSDLWLKCRTKCLNNVSIQTGRKAVHNWLAGKSSVVTVAMLFHGRYLRTRKPIISVLTV